MGKPFDKDLARDATERTSKLVGVLNKYLKKDSTPSWGLVKTRT